jgi:hypothetical protein
MSAIRAMAVITRPQLQSQPYAPCASQADPSRRGWWRRAVERGGRAWEVWGGMAKFHSRVGPMRTVDARSPALDRRDDARLSDLYGSTPTPGAPPGPP